MSNTETLSRQQLYNLVWPTPLLTLSKKYTLSDNGLRKICIRMQIPLPQAGHWMRLKFNKKVRIVSLNGNYNGEDSVALPLRTEKSPPPTENPVKLLAHALGNDKTISFDVPERLHSKDPLIIAAKERLTAKNRYDRTGVVYCHTGELDIKVGIDNVDRMLRFADTLLRILQHRRHTIDFISGYTAISVNGQRMKILFRERLKRHIVKGTHYDSTELHPTGLLVFKLDNYPSKEWKDGKQRLEYYLPEIVATLEVESLRLNKRDEEWRRERLLREQEEDKQKELHARKVKDLDDFKGMLSKAERWHQADNLRRYIDEVKRKGFMSAEWIAWACRKADWYDPFIEAEDEMLGNYSEKFF